MKGAKLNVAVIGAGISGLSTATCIQESLPAANVTIIADKFMDETLSIGAGGLFRPELEIGSSFDEIVKYYKDTYDHFVKVCLSEEKAGIQFVSGYHLSSIDQNICMNKLLSNLLPDMRLAPSDELQRLFPQRFKYGYFYTTTITDPRYYLPWLQNKFLNAGGKMEKRFIANLQTDATLKDFDAIVNCSGLGAKNLLNDWRLVPIRGQVIKVKAPWIKHFYFADGAYIIPAFDGLVTLGGIKQYGDWTSKVREEDKQFIWSRCTELVPSLQNAEVCWEWCGLRPHRQPLRLESEIIEVNGSRIPLIHNYGHGGHGVSLSRGTALKAAALLNEKLDRNHYLKSKL
ncbi:D-aspartate oxidase-like protein [Dinothrombium tinctorium]|uniref:D-aspartate oxidase-like protein n=1 Tax=Dinothrombium tinctorium TaxID=1965070 RepID=A0A3S3NWA8_9ACAR|nr:D-aspartate oxidase-like protein [Dinothrombium tinctorium]